MTIRDVTPPDKLAETTDLFRRLAAWETVSPFETQRVAKDGRVVDIWLTATAVWDEAGKSVEAFATTERDITGRKKAEKEVERLNEALTHKVSELEAANRDLEAFTHSVSHDLRAPLRHVSEFSRIVAGDYADRLDEQAKDCLARVRRGAEKMNQLVESLLRLSRIARQKIERTEVDMITTALTVVAELREAEAGRRVEVDIQEGLIAFADPALLEVVLSNLIGNAWKFTSKTANARIQFGALEQRDTAHLSPSREGTV